MSSVFPARLKSPSYYISALRPYVPFLLTLLLTGIIVFARIQLFPRINPHQLIALFLLPVTLVSLFTHWRAGIFATIVNALFLAYFLYYSDVVFLTQTWLLFGLFILQGILIAHIQRSRLRLDKETSLFVETFQYLPEPIIITDKAKRIVYLNKQAEKILDLKKQNIINKKFSDVTGIPFEETTQPFLYRSRKSGNRYLNVSLSEITSNSPYKGGFTTILHDVTDQEFQRLSRERLLKAGKVIVSTLDVQHAIHFTAKTAIPRLGDSMIVFTFDEDGILKVVSVVHDNPEKEKQLQQYVKKSIPEEQYLFGVSNAIQTGATNISKHITKSRHHDPLSLFENLHPKASIAAPLIARNRPIGAILFLRSDQNASYSQLQAEEARNLADIVAVALDNAQLYHNMHEAVRLREEHLSIASHELKTPLTSLLLQLQSVLKSIYRDPLANLSIEKLLSLLKNAQEQSNRLAHLIDSLLDVSRITPGKVDLKTEKMDLTQTVKKITEGFSEQLEKSGSSIDLKSNGPIMGQWDKVRIGQVVTNLITNAIKYGAGNPIVIHLEETDTRARITIQDHGIGIPEEKQKEIFKPFTRAVSNSQYDGLGLGLYVTQQIVRSHHGKIRVESDSQTGTAFIVDLPLKPKEN